MIPNASREALLRPEFATKYPNLQPGRWMPAERALANVMESPTLGLRLSDQHFTFRGGHARGSENRLKTRAVDM